MRRFAIRLSSPQRRWERGLIAAMFELNSRDYASFTSNQLFGGTPHRSDQFAMLKKSSSIYRLMFSGHCDPEKNEMLSAHEGDYVRWAIPHWRLAAKNRNHNANSRRPVHLLDGTRYLEEKGNLHPESLAWPYM